MGQRTTAELLKPGEHLVCFEPYHMSGLWGVLIAPSAESIRVKYPELEIFGSLPEWLDEAELAQMQGTPLWLDDEPPQGLLHALVASREHG
jgi:hypothetical protein